LNVYECCSAWRVASRRSGYEPLLLHTLLHSMSAPNVARALTRRVTTATMPLSLITLT
jgi:hypothetical protein